ncbi:hypothetical protein [Paenibacillus paeoniae]|uniref:Uncharacterized protein n=1 Tax=Paenibacillus paeoniae TaxID=2292705 RepID=A0A371PKI9_9BACL|nr:hypothetical protein [Paenibacillus paeoniae]REK76189.1 hypothetical protein DX130_03785 [Paenibacillus paeoniae]
MSKFVCKPWIAVLLLVTCLTVVFGHFQVHALTAGQPLDASDSAVQKQAKSWVDELSTKPGYKTWRGTNITMSPLGPGMHSWLAIVQNKAKEPVGYLVIHAVEQGGFQLGEYGTGPYPLFNEQSLQLSLLQLELINKQTKAERVYSSPLHAAWRISSKSIVHYADAVSGEQLPISKDDEWNEPKDEANVPSGLTDSGAKINNSTVIPAFNPYGRLPWLTKAPFAISDKNYSSLLKLITDKKEIRYTSESFEGKLLQVWSIVGFDTWEGGQIYIALGKDEDDDRRYMPIDLLSKQGKFYR